MKNAFFTFLILAGSLGPLHAQKQWTYADCISYARENNITLRQSRLSEQTAALDLEAARAQWQPSLDFATSHAYINTPWGAGKRNAYNSSYGLQGEWQVYDGGVRSNTIKRDRLMLERSQLSTENELRTLDTDILSLYLNILYAGEQIDICSDAAELSRVQAERGKALLESGRISKVDYAQLNSQYEQDRYNLVNARATFDTRRMELKQLLQLGYDTDLRIAPCDWTREQVLADLPDIEQSYILAKDIDVRRAMLRLDSRAAAVDVDIAKAGRAPRIGLSAGVGTSYYAPGQAFGTGLKQGWNEQIGLNLSIPVLDQKKTSTAVAKAKVLQSDADLEIERRDLELSSAIENWYIDTRSAQARYIAALSQLESAELTDSLTNERFLLGYVDPVELLSSHTALSEARHALLQAKFMAILGQKMIQYYRTANITIQ